MIKNTKKLFSKKKRPSFLPNSIKNYNFEQFKNYSNYYKKAVEQKDILVKKLDPSNFIKKFKKEKILDMDTKDYYCWRIFDSLEHTEDFVPFEVVTHSKIKTTPKLMVQTFGYPNFNDAFHFRTLGIYRFQDCYNNYFEVIDYQNKEEFKANDNKNYEGVYKKLYDSEEEYTFRISCSDRGFRHKFLGFLLKELKIVENDPEKSFYNKMVEKFGKPQLFQDYDEVYEEKRIPLVFTQSRKDYEKLGKTHLDFIDDKIYDTSPEIQKDIRNEKNVQIIEES